jgi:uncharacterized OB-fold protein
MRAPRLDGWRCPRGHVYLHAHETCPECGLRLRATRIAPRATLILVTYVRVSPSAEPFRLGLAVTRCGRARTLCRVEGCVRGNGRDAVLLHRRGETIIARAARSRA